MRYFLLGISCCIFASFLCLFGCSQTSLQSPQARANERESMGFKSIAGKKKISSSAKKRTVCSYTIFPSEIPKTSEREPVQKKEKSFHTQGSFSILGDSNSHCTSRENGKIWEALMKFLYFQAKYPKMNEFQKKMLILILAPDVFPVMDLNERDKKMFPVIREFYFMLSPYAVWWDSCKNFCKGTK